MMRKKIYELMEMFPYFFDKSESSNFFKSQSVTNNQLLKVYQSLMEVKDSLRLDKKCCIWKEQSVPYDYTINFLVNYPLLKSVKCYKNDTLIYMEEYLEEDNINSFTYAYNSDEENEINQNDNEDIEEETQEEDIPIIPEDTFHIIVETYEEYLIQKGFPENDTIQGDMYDHDESLDEIGALNGVQRKTYKSTDDYEHTEPPYNNRLSEDDYHYMNRIIEYNLKIHNTPLPVLEIWKEYGIFSDMINREEYLLKMFDEHMHPYDEETGLVGDWTPMPWEHKDRLCELTSDNGRFFFVSANTLMPVKNQNVIFNFQFLNSLAEKLTGDYSVTITLLGDEEDTVLVENYTGEQYTVTSDLISDDAPNVFKFEAYEGPTIFETETLEVTVRGCNTGNWYVSTSGNDNNTGKIDDPFATLDKALSMVNGEENLIVLTSGTHSTDHIYNVPYTCTILGCGNPTINNSVGLKFFRVYQNQSLNLQDITLTHDTSSTLVSNSNWINNNKNTNQLYVVISEGAGKTSTILTLSTDKSTYTIGETIEIRGSLTDDELTALTGKSIKIYVNNTLVDTVTTQGNAGNFSKDITANISGAVSIKAVFEGDEDYYSNNATENLTVNKKPTTITFNADKSSYDLGETITLSGTLKTGTTGMDDVDIKIYDGETLLDTVTTDNGTFSKTLTASIVSSKTYKAVYEGDGTYDSATSSDVNVSIVKRTPTISLVTSSASVTTGDSYTLSGALLYGGSGLGSVNIKLYDGNTLIDPQLTTGNDGTFSKSITSSVAGTFSYKVVYEGDATYNNVESSIVNVVVSDRPAPASITVSSDKPIMMKGETATITAKVLDANGNPCVGETVSFEVVNGESLGSDVTDSSGEASVYYLGKDAYLLNIKGILGSLEDTVEILDLFYYNTLTSATSSWIPQGNTINYSFGNNGLSTTGTSGGCYLKFNETLPSNFSVELELTGITYLSSGLGGGFSVDNTFIEFSKTKTGFHNRDAHDYNVVFSSGDIVKITSNNGTISLYKNNVLIASNTSTVTGFDGFSVRNVGACGVSFKNLKIHEL